jgi:hypothetical protein
MNAGADSDVWVWGVGVVAHGGVLVRLTCWEVGLASISILLAGVVGRGLSWCFPVQCLTSLRNLIGFEI